MQTEFPYPNTDDEWTLYGAEWCGYCRAAKQLFKDHEIEVTYHDADNLDRDKLSSISNGQTTIPVIFNKGVLIGGYTELLELNL
jgi:glutaredoxin